MTNRLSIIATLGIVLSLVSNRFTRSQDLEELSLLEAEQRISQLEQSVAKLGHYRAHDPLPRVSREAVYCGYSFLFAKLDYQESFQAMVTDLSTGSLLLLPFEHNYELTPRAWLGYQASSGLGVRTTFWNFDHGGEGLSLVSGGGRFPSATSATVIFPALITAIVPGDRLVVATSLEATTLDLEGTYEAQLKKMELLVSGGIRYARADQQYHARVIGVIPASLDWEREFEGIGPTLGATGRLPIGESGFYVTGNARLSFLFGEKTLTRRVVNDMSPNPTPPVVALNNADEVSGTYATGVGVGWRRHGKLLDSFAEATYESQLWTAGGSPTLTFLGFNGLGLNLGVAF